ncbi:multidrug effflux MFS transporter [Levilactobacillus zymae]|uniref:multidrug effflux MFS transporter n=1 Tax=Levilactobacillus zymae TaxID=267363 RepID=UPI0028B93456|nr:multidrug effflux MFS transporter [Levilactobacillus zymae]MDT6980850.1 multidrug effflux MFS transporter [Levilactobacillus zymae]
MRNVQKKTPTLWLIIVLVGFPQISESIFTPVLPALSQALQVSASHIQWTMSSYFVAFAVGVLWWGQLADRIGRRPAMLGGVGLYLLGNLGLLFSPSFGWLLGFRLLQAFGASAGSVVTQTIMRESFSGVVGAKIFAQTSAAMALSPALGPLIGGAMQTLGGYSAVFGTLVVLASAVLGYSACCLPETRPSQVALTGRQWPIVHRLLSDPVVWGYGILIGGINGILFSYYAEAPFIFETHFRFSALAYGALGLSLAAASLGGALLVSWLLNRWTPEQLVMGGLLLSCGAALGLWLAAICDTAWGMVGGFFLVFLGLNIALPNALNRALIGYEDVIGSASGWFSLGYYLLVSALTYGMSLLHSTSIQRLPVYCLVLVGGMLGVYVGLVPRTRTHRLSAESTD